MNENPLDDFIAVYDHVLNVSQCDKLVRNFKELKSQNLVFRGDFPLGQVSDERISLINSALASLNPPQEREFLWGQIHSYCLQYMQSYPEAFGPNIEQRSVLMVENAMMQETRPSGGFHPWHYEATDMATQGRFLTWILYLNDIDEGGETEFLYQRKRLSPKTGTLVVWPTGFTHTHRGNPPLKDTKYIITGWHRWSD